MPNQLKEQTRWIARASDWGSQLYSDPQLARVAFDRLRPATRLAGVLDDYRCQHSDVIHISSWPLTRIKTMIRSAQLGTSNRHQRSWHGYNLAQSS